MIIEVLKEIHTPEGYILKPGTNIEVTEIDIDGTYWIKYKTKYTVIRFGIPPIMVKKGFVTEIIKPTEKEQEQWLDLLTQY